MLASKIGHNLTLNMEMSLERKQVGKEIGSVGLRNSLRLGWLQPSASSLAR